MPSSANSARSEAVIGGKFGLGTQMFGGIRTISPGPMSRVKSVTFQWTM